MTRSLNENQINRCCFAVHSGRKCDGRPQNWRLQEDEVEAPECAINVTRDRLVEPFGETAFDFMRRACEEEINGGQLAVLLDRDKSTTSRLLDGLRADLRTILLASMDPTAVSQMALEKAITHALIRIRPAVLTESMCNELAKWGGYVLLDPHTATRATLPAGYTVEFTRVPRMRYCRPPIARVIARYVRSYEGTIFGLKRAYFAAWSDHTGDCVLGVVKLRAEAVALEPDDRDRRRRSRAA